MATKTRLGRIVDAMVELDAIWGRSAIAIIMTDQFHSSDPYVTPDSLAARLKVSDDSARRWLAELVEQRLVVIDIAMGRRFYRTTEEHAFRVMELVEAVDGQARPQAGNSFIQD